MARVAVASEVRDQTGFLGNDCPALQGKETDYSIQPLMQPYPLPLNFVCAPTA